MSDIKPVLGNRVTKAVALRRFEILDKSIHPDLLPLLAFVWNIATNNHWENDIDIDDDNHVIDDIDRWLDYTLDGDGTNRPFDDNEIAYFRKIFCSKFGYDFDPDLRQVKRALVVEPMDERLLSCIDLITVNLALPALWHQLKEGKLRAMENWAHNHLENGTLKPFLLAMVGHLRDGSIDVRNASNPFSRAINVVLYYLRGQMSREQALIEIVRLDQQIPNKNEKWE